MSASISSSTPLTHIRIHTKSDSLSSWNTGFIPRKSSRGYAQPIPLDGYFHGPIDARGHSKWPLFMRIRGSVLPKIILPLFVVAVWSIIITVFSECVHELGFSSILLTVLGFVVGLSLSFRSATAYERYDEGRRHWATLLLTSRNMARLVWTHAKERFDESEELGKLDLLAKLSALNLLKAFAVALKHRLRFEPSTQYADLEPWIAHLDTFASKADQTGLHQRTPSRLKVMGEYLGLSFAESNPRKLVKRSKDNLGNLPLEILNYLSAYTESLFANKQLCLSTHQDWAMTHINTFTDVLTGTERILNTPLPVAYTISISQITWVYVMVLPFQLRVGLGWVTIPATILAAYIILGLSAIGAEIENPFGRDVNDLPLEQYCHELITDIDSLTAAPAPQTDSFVRNPQNRAFFPLSSLGMPDWESRDVEEIREILEEKAMMKMGSFTAEVKIEDERGNDSNSDELTTEV